MRYKAAEQNFAAFFSCNFHKRCTADRQKDKIITPFFQYFEKYFINRSYNIEHTFAFKSHIAYPTAFRLHFLPQHIQKRKIYR